MCHIAGAVVTGEIFSSFVAKWNFAMPFFVFAVGGERCELFDDAKTRENVHLALHSSAEYGNSPWRDEAKFP